MNDPSDIRTIAGTKPSAVIAEIESLFDELGDRRYGSESVTQREHALQTAALAEADRADAALVTAALLHDIGHLLHGDNLPDTDRPNLDDRHEEAGRDWLAEHFTPEVCEPVRLHVAAKRYLCTVEDDYVRQLSPTSMKSFLDQGGVMSAEEVDAFRSHPHFESGIRLRRWDDLAKTPDLPTKAFSEYTPMIRNQMVLEDKP